MHSFSQSQRIDANINVTTLVHQLKMRGTLNPRCRACEGQVELQGDSLRVFCGRTEKKRRCELKNATLNLHIAAPLSTCVFWKDGFNSNAVI